MTHATISVKGVVQGVGFRPFIYRIALEHGLSGYVANTAAGVEIEAAGPEAAIDRFTAAIAGRKPPLARIDELLLNKRPGQDEKIFDSFIIRESIAAGSLIGPVTPDSDVCPNCLAELFDPADRRYLYPFINCTDCGPRFTLIEETPYDRAKTSMKSFVMCPACAAEYRDPVDRRFHAQANCCPACGPALSLCDNKGQDLENINSGDEIAAAVRLLKSGKILAVKGIGGFHLAVDAADAGAVARLRSRKGRPDKPLAVMALDLDAIRNFAILDNEEEGAITAPARPVILLRKKTDFPLATNLAPDNCFIGVMLPYTPLHYLLFRAGGFQALVMTSANLSGSPVIIDNQEALARLPAVADYFLMHDRPIIARNDDSVLRLAQGRSSLIRRSRSFVPEGIKLKYDAGRTLGLGAMIKNTVCLTRGAEAFLSPHIGDLENIDTIHGQEQAIAHFCSLLRIEPELLAHDLHPDYPGTRYALRQKKYPCQAVQHHHAHAVSCMAEHGLAGPLIALCLDGNGFGPDHTVWGGEVLLAGLDDYQRAAHLSTVPMPGSEAAIREPWRMAISHLFNSYGHDFINLDLELLRAHAPDLEILTMMMEKNINSPLTSSCGRLFDAIAALLGLRHTVSFEGQAAAELEMLAMVQAEEESSYPYTMDIDNSRPWQLHTMPIIKSVVDDILQDLPAGLISIRFHNTLAGLFTETCLRLREKHKLNQVVLSGGVFQNLTLLNRLYKKLKGHDFQVFTHSRVPANDGGIALGQAVAGRAKTRRQASGIR